MPIKRLEKARASLPEDYQFGDAAATSATPNCVDTQTGIAIRFVRQYNILTPVRPRRFTEASELIQTSNLVESLRGESR